MTQWFNQTRFDVVAISLNQYGGGEIAYAASGCLSCGTDYCGQGASVCSTRSTNNKRQLRFRFRGRAQRIVGAAEGRVYAAPPDQSSARCCSCFGANSNKLKASDLNDEVIRQLAGWGARIELADNQQLDCAAEHWGRQFGRAAGRAQWRLAVYSLLVFGDTTGVAPDIARQIVWLALPRGR